MNKHGRPRRVYFHSPGLGKPYLCRDQDYQWSYAGWRRSHSARVWQAIQAVLAVAAVDDCGEWVNPGAQRYCVASAAGWLTEEAR